MARLAIVGTGRMASIHFKNLANHPTARCDFVVSNSLSRAQQFISTHTSNVNGQPSTKASSDLPALLQQHRHEIDGVIITSNSKQHYSDIKTSLLNEKPVFVEKPMAESVAEIDQLYELAAERNLPAILVGYQRRFDPNIQTAYSQIHDKNALLPLHDASTLDLKPCPAGIEKIVSISKDPTYPDIDYMNESINCFFDSIIHDIDTICYMTKQFPCKVYTAAHAHYNPVARANDFDRVFITLHFESGLLGMIDWCRHSGFSYDQRLNILGYNGMLEITNERDSLCVVHSNQGAQMAPPKDYFLERYEKAYRNEIYEFVRVIQEESKAVSTTWQQVRNVNIICACAQQSAHSGQPVEIEYTMKLKK